MGERKAWYNKLLHRTSDNLFLKEGKEKGKQTTRKGENKKKSAKRNLKKFVYRPAN